MIGEAFKHKEELLSQLDADVEIIGLPSSAAYLPEYDQGIGKEDVVISLKFSRKNSGKPAFRLLHVPGAGLDGIDTDSLAQGCMLCNVFEHQVPIAEYVMLAMLEWEIKFSEMRRSFIPEKWADIYSRRIPHGELYCKTLGLVGFGGIGKAIAVRAKVFGMKVIAVDKFANNDHGLADVLLKNEDIDEALKECDYVVISCPLTEETRGWINKDRLEKMKAGAVLINISRGGIISQKDAYEALSEKKIAGAVFDVWWNYPKSPEERVYPSDYPFHLLDNVICTPHSCAWTKELTWRRYGVIAKNIDNLIAGSPLKNLVCIKK